MLSLEEFSHRYLKTFIRHNNEVLFVEGIDFYTKSLLLYGSGGVQSYNYLSIYNTLDLEPPNAQYFNCNDYAIFLFRRPKRQWLRGLSGQTHEMFNPLNRISPTKLYSPKFNLNSVKSIYLKTYPELAEDLLNKIQTENKVISVAISPTLAISKSCIIKTPIILWLRVDPIGYLIKENKFVLKDYIYAQETYDELLRLGFNKWIF